MGIIIFLVVWSIVGLVIEGGLTNEGIIHKDMGLFPAILSAILCGPIAMLVVLYGVIYGIIRAIIIILSQK